MDKEIAVSKTPENSNRTKKLNFLRAYPTKYNSLAPSIKVDSCETKSMSWNFFSCDQFTDSDTRRINHQSPSSQFSQRACDFFLFLLSAAAVKMHNLVDAAGVCAGVRVVRRPYTLSLSAALRTQLSRSGRRRQLLRRIQTAALDLNAQRSQLFSSALSSSFRLWIAHLFACVKCYWLWKFASVDCVRETFLALR